MKTIAAMLTLGVACWAFGTQAQTFDTRLLSQYDASVLRELYPVCRHTTVSAEQQVRLAERIRQENLRFAELIRCDGGVLAPASETELERMRDNALREILTEEQLLQYYRYEALPAAYARGREAKKIVSKQLQLTYMELKYVNNAFFVIEQETQAAKKFWRGNPAEARDQNPQRLRTRNRAARGQERNPDRQTNACGAGRGIDRLRSADAYRKVIVRDLRPHGTVLRDGLFSCQRSTCCVRVSPKRDTTRIVTRSERGVQRNR